ncbi:mechanosensitive ion channel protein MscS [Pontibacter sp. E15-1]|uniref:mechanosensitive ion channel protein MscS n=1 Tax=Pontibacter sp. E15-1 TaxID=2919918 RepID=UPI001F4F41EB|nr:mechanosensitive ion channel protein MscS [Pontibacter sp. E15-1]MCJ8164462.1 mechanosensitive ion channel protein MscS [Pontibacter sp. E15-1]
MTLLRNIIYAILLGVSMAACLSQNDEAATESRAQEEAAAATELEVQPAPDPALLIIEKGRVGDVRLGMPLEEVRQQVALGTVVTDTLLQMEGTASTAYLLRTDSQKKGLLVEQHCEPRCTVWRISVLGPDFKTSKGIGVGSKYSEVKAAYPIGVVAFEGGNFVAVSEELGMSFVLDHTQLPQDYKERGKYTPENIPANTLVKRVLLY